ncbi:endoplasmic reticulum-Golgi intermediate compartment protein 2 isoform X2 [Colossoma macropomum]|uniref:endoplasmic reticulum-Golgi intermediate compartment protein 2 isoform X2 n=1 Tax=Colossoma macropomum TaxID=42526 RepID=UPI0018649F28|nr:endoplasmic reticulum-Golgi intermediate compartment protein 2 isoform X2 [Colossoma macropomum]
MRRLNRKRALSLVKELDAFPKVPESYVETSAFGGAVSLTVFASMALLTVLEFFVYQDTWMKYEYEVDKDFSSKLRINIDITVAMECQMVGADVLDRANTMVSLTELRYEPVNFELNPWQRFWQKTLLQSQSKLREEQSLQHVLFRDAVKEFLFPPVLRSDSLSGSLNACRILGHFYVNKVEGNLHFTLGKAVHYSGGHAHFGSLLTNNVQNFSHRIDHLSFGEVVPGRINPLDATEKITLEREQRFQYFVTIVPTKLRTSELSIDTHQYSVTEQEQVINHTSGSHGASGIFVKYKLNPLMVRVTEEHMPIGKFLVRLSGIIGGIFSTSDLLHRLVGLFVDIVCCRFNLGALRPRQVLS